MGYWTIVVQGCGCHHNSTDGDGSQPPHDANRMAAKFVKELASAGHEITVASFTHSGRDDLIPMAHMLRESERNKSAPQ